MITISQVTISINHNQEQLYKKVSKLLGVYPADIKELHILKRSIDARKKPQLSYSYVVEVKVDQEERVLQRSKCKDARLSKREKYQFPYRNTKELKQKMVIVGAGPAGLFCAYMLSKHGFPVLLLERGKEVEQRCKDVEHFWNTGELKVESNVQFGEGGAGTFSDGKLNTLVKDKDGRNHQVLSTLVEFGANEEILYDNKPHIGTDVLVGIVKNMRHAILSMGGEVRFESKVTDLMIDKDQVKGVILEDGTKICSDHVVLALGHSARDSFRMLYEKGIAMEAKSFAVGFRVEHKQSLINRAMYGVEEEEILGAAPYKVTAKTSVNRGVYSFCMCPGGYVVNASSQEGRTVVNGMSYSKRDSKNANSAIIVSVTPEDFGGDSPLAGIEFQERLEEKVFQLGSGKIPIQRYGEFKAKVRKETVTKVEESDLSPCIKGDYCFEDLTSIFTEEINQAFVEGMEHFKKIIPGFSKDDVLLEAVESRTSSPIRIHRNENLEAGISGIYPCGEGAGYAGGITSAAMDGIRVAEYIAKSIS